MSNNPTELEVFIHDIASPLTNIGVSLENMKTQIYSNPHQLERTILSTIDSLEYLFSITRQKSTRIINLQNSTYSLSQLIQEIIRNKFNFILEKNNITLTLILHENIFVSFDRILLNRAITNIISNSIDALIEKPSRKHRKLKISANKTNSHILITIIDNGIGISNESLQSVFNLGYSKKDNHQGIGLPTSKDIVENKFYGKFDINSLTGIGTIVRIHLPI